MVSGVWPNRPTPLTIASWIKTCRSSMRTTTCGTWKARCAIHGIRSGEHAWLGDYSQIRRTYLPAEYRRDTALHNVVATVHVEAECDRTQQREETEWLSGVAADTGMPNVIVAHAWVDTPDAEIIIAAQAANPMVRGIRTKPIIAVGPTDSVRGQPRSLQDPAWRNGLALLRKYGLSWDLRVPWYHLEEAAEVCREHPTLPIVLNHTGYPLDRSKEQLAMWKRGMRPWPPAPTSGARFPA